MILSRPPTTQSDRTALRVDERRSPVGAGGCVGGRGLIAKRAVPRRWLVAPSPQVPVDPAALPLKLVDFAFAVVLAPSLEGQNLQVAREMLELGQQFSYRPPTQRSDVCAESETARRGGPLLAERRRPSGGSVSVP